MEFPKTDVGGQNRGPKPVRSCGGFTRRGRGRQPMARLFSAQKRPFRQARIGTVCLFRVCTYLWLMTVHFPFQNTYSALPANFFARVAPTPVASPRLIKLNRPLALQLGLDPDLLGSPEGAQIPTRKRRPDAPEPS